jgi:glycosyltransferase involved in cell wall biosynthesis
LKEQGRAAARAGTRPRIAIDVTSAVAQGGGIGRYTRDLVRALARGDTRLEYHLFSARPAESLGVALPLPSGAHVVVHRAPLDERWLYRIWHRLRLPLPVQLFTGRVDLFHATDFVLPPVAGGIPTLLTVHDLSFVKYPEAFIPALVAFLDRAVRRSVGRASHVLADSQSTREDLRRLWNVPDEKISVLYSGVDGRFRPVTERRALEAVRKKYGLGDRPYLFSASTLQPRKNYPMLIRAFRPVAERWPHLLAIAGARGWLYQEIEDEIAAQGLSDRVLLLGFADEADLPALYSGASLFAFPSLYEGFGLPVLEAMACGAPVLSSNASSLPEVAGEAAILLPPDDEAAWSRQIERLLGEPAERGRMVAAGFRQARRFSWAESARQLTGLYRRLLGQ